MTDDTWPALPYDGWKDTHATLHMWLQVVGKIALALSPPLNHSWGVALQVTARGLATRTLPHGRRSFPIEFNFVDHELAIRATDGDAKTLPLRPPRSVADFYRDVMSALRDMGLAVRIWSMPVEVESPVRFEENTAPGTYDSASANRCWRI